MATAEVVSPVERAVLARVRGQLARLGDGCSTIGIRSSGRPRWRGPDSVSLDGTPVRIVACPSVLAVLDALARAERDEITVLYTDLPERDLGDAILARLHRHRLLDADRYTQLADLLGARALDPRIRHETWLVDALIALAEEGKAPPTAGAALSLGRAIALVAAARLGLDPEQADLPALVAAFDDTRVRSDWRRLAEAERQQLVAHLADRHGGGVHVVAALAERHDDVLGLLLVAQVLTAASPDDTRAASALGGFEQVRLPALRRNRQDLAEAGSAAVAYARAAPAARLTHQARVAETALDDLSALELAGLSPVLPTGFVDRLAAAAESFDLAPLESHQLAGVDDWSHRVERVRCAGRLHRWLENRPERAYVTAAEGAAHHARELAWVDRALTQIRAGDADPRVATVLRHLTRRAGVVRAQSDRAFAAKFAAMEQTPTTALAVETFLPAVVAPLARQAPVLLVVIDGMSGAVTGELTDVLADRRTGWTEIVRAPDGGRESVLATLPTETRYSRASLFCAELRSGEQALERSAFPVHSFWPPGCTAALIHKSGIAGQDGADLGAELEAAVGENGPRVVAVVLNTVDDSLTKGRQARNPAWRPEHIAGLPQLLDRAVAAGRVVLLTSDHGHVLEHGAEHRHRPGGGVRWRPDDGAPQDDEVVGRGTRVLLPAGQAIFAATEDVRYGARAHGYHGGATLAEAAIPLVGLLPPGAELPAGWVEHTLGAPPWWDGTVVTPAVPPVSPKRKPTRKPAGSDAEGLFEMPATAPALSRGAQLIASPGFQDARKEIPANRAPAPEVFRAVVDALLTAGGRLPLNGIVAAAGADGRNPRGLVHSMRRVLNRDSYAVLELVDGGRAAELNRALLDEQFPVDA